MSNRKAIPKERPVDSRSVDWMSGYSEGQARRACSYGLPGVRKPDERNWLAGWLRGTAYANQMADGAQTPEQVERVPQLMEMFTNLLAATGWKWQDIKDAHARVLESRVP